MLRCSLDDVKRLQFQLALQPRELVFNRGIDQFRADFDDKTAEQPFIFLHAHMYFAAGERLQLRGELLFLIVRERLRRAHLGRKFAALFGKLGQKRTAHRAQLREPAILCDEGEEIIGKGVEFGRFREFLHRFYKFGAGDVEIDRENMEILVFMRQLFERAQIGGYGIERVLLLGEIEQRAAVTAGQYRCVSGNRGLIGARQNNLFSVNTLISKPRFE